LQSIRAQTRPCDSIIVVDNASTDDTRAMLQQHWSDTVTVHTLPKNVGASGGFNRALHLSYRTGADFIWLMDDDVIPEPDALEGLLKASERLDAEGVQPGFLVSTVTTQDGLATNVPDIDYRANPIGYKDWASYLHLSLVPVTRATFVSILLPRATIARHGLPISSMFIWADDTEYTLRVTATQKAFVVGGSRVVHLRAMSGVPDIFHESNPRRIEYHKYSVRNHLYVAKRHRGRRAALRYAGEQIAVALKLCRSGMFRKAAVVASGLIQGIAFSPAVEAADSGGPYEVAAPSDA
jgi:dTDP-4-dehydrorhamnose reductase